MKSIFNFAEHGKMMLVPGYYLLALQENGVAEMRGGPIHNARILEYHAATTLGAKTDEVPWCSSFVNWCMMKTNTPRTKSATARSWQTFGRALRDPYPGCIVVLSADERGPDAGHVGFVHWRQMGDEHEITVWGGNQGNRVCAAQYDLSRVLGYREPAV